MNWSPKWLMTVSHSAVYFFNSLSKAWSTACETQITSDLVVTLRAEDALQPHDG